MCRKMGNRYSLFREKVKALRPLIEHLQNRVRTLIGAENDTPCRHELRNALRQLRKRMNQILEIPSEQCPLPERTAIALLRGELHAVSRILIRSRGHLLSEPQVKFQIN